MLALPQQTYRRFRHLKRLSLIFEDRSRTVNTNRHTESVEVISHDTRRIARSLGLKPVNTPVCSPQSNGMAESFVKTFRRDSVSRMDLSDATRVLAQLPAAFEHFNEVHPHSGLKFAHRVNSGNIASAWASQTARRSIANRPCPVIRGQFQSHLPIQWGDCAQCHLLNDVPRRTDHAACGPPRWQNSANHPPVNCEH